MRDICGRKVVERKARGGWKKGERKVRARREKEVR